MLNRGKLLIVFTVLLSSLTGNANGSTGDNLYHEKKFDQAEKAYAKTLEKIPENAILHFNLGDVQYKKKTYEKAISSYTKALQNDDLELQAKSYYNRGNANYQLAGTHLKTDPEQTMELYRKAISDYEGSLALKPDDPDTTYNRDFVKQQLKELEKQQQKKQEQKNNKDKKKKQDNKKNKNQDKQQNGNGEKNKQEQQKPGQENNPNKQQKNKGAQSQEQKNQESGSKKEAARPKNEDRKKGEQTGMSTGNKAANGKGMSNEDKQRRQQGKMTSQEARSLLDALEDEEGRLDFIPQGSGNNQDHPLRNW